MVKLNLDEEISFSSQSLPREQLPSGGVWEFPSNGEIAIMNGGDSKIVADYACGRSKISGTNRYRLLRLTLYIESLGNWRDNCEQ